MAAVNLSPDEVPALDTTEFLIFLSSWAVGFPAAGSLVNMLLNTIFGSPAPDAQQFWPALAPRIENMIDTAIWTENNAHILAIQEELNNIAPESDNDIYNGLNTSIRQSCFFLRNVLISAAGTQDQDCAFALNSYYAIGFLDLATWKMQIALEEKLNKGSNVVTQHQTDLDAAETLYTSTKEDGDNALYPKLIAGYNAWRPSTFQRQPADWDPSVEFPPYSYVAYDTFKSEIVQDSGGQVETDAAFAAFVAGQVSEEVEDYDSGTLQPLAVLVDPGTSPLALLSGADVTLGISDGLAIFGLSLGDAFALVTAGDATQLGLQRETPISPLNQRNLFIIEKADGSTGPLFYGDAVTIRSKPFSQYLSAGSGDGSQRVMLATAHDGAPQEWIVVNPFDPFLSGFSKDVWQCPVTTSGQLFLQNSATQQYLGVMPPPPGSSAADKYGYFALTPANGGGGTCLVSNLTEPCNSGSGPLLINQ